MTTWPLQSACAKFYGDPRGAKGKASPAWEKANLVTVECPWVLRFDGKPVKGIVVHRKCADSLKEVLAAIWERLGRSQAEIDRIGMGAFSGSYAFRQIRGRSSLSMHAYGAAVDFDAGHNSLGDATPDMDRRVIEEFERRGWEWGGHWSRPDGMHFQAAWTRANPPRLAAAPAAAPSGSSADVKRLQAALKGLGYFEVGQADGQMGSKTRGALLAFKADNGLPLSADLDDATWAALAKARPRAVAEERAAATMPPSGAAKVADAAKKAGGTAVGLGIADTALSPVGGIKGAVTALGDAGDTAGKVRDALSPFGDLISSLSSNWPLLLIVGGVALFFVGRYVFRDELASFRRGEWS
jgi:hypothetical protein